jgi:hypothetical protein
MSENILYPVYLPYQPIELYALHPKELNSIRLPQRIIGVHAVIAAMN